MNTKREYSAPETTVILLAAEQVVMAWSGEYTGIGMDDVINHDWN